MFNCATPTRWRFGKDECMELKKALGAVLKKLEAAARGRACLLITIHPKAILPKLLLAVAQCDLEERFCSVVTAVADLRLGMAAAAAPADADLYAGLGLEQALLSCREAWRLTMPSHPVAAATDANKANRMMRDIGDKALFAVARPLRSPEVCRHLFDTPQFRIGYHEVVVKALGAETGTVVCRLDGWFGTEQTATTILLTSGALGADAREQTVRSDGSFAVAVPRSKTGVKSLKIEQVVGFAYDMSWRPQLENRPTSKAIPAEQERKVTKSSAEMREEITRVERRQAPVPSAAPPNLSSTRPVQPVAAAVPSAAPQNLISTKPVPITPEAGPPAPAAAVDWSDVEIPDDSFARFKNLRNVSPTFRPFLKTLLQLVLSDRRGQLDEGDFELGDKILGKFAAAQINSLERLRGVVRAWKTELDREAIKECIDESYCTWEDELQDDGGCCPKPGT